MMKSWRSSPYAIKDVDEDEEECDEHCHPESESETSASCINVQKNIVEDCQWKSCALYPQNEAVRFLDQCSCYLRVSGSMQLIFGKSILSLWLTLLWPLLTAKLKANHCAQFHIGKNSREITKGIWSTQGLQGLRLQAWQGICFIYFPLGRGNCCYRHALVCNGEGEQSGENNSVLGGKSSPAGDHLWFDHEADPADNDKHAAGQVDLEHGPAFGTGQRIVRRPGWHTASASSEGALGSHRPSSCLHEDRRWKGGWL